MSGQGSWETTLKARDLDGDPSTIEAYYDTDLDITWLADANYAKISGYDADGEMNWTEANVWAAGLNISGISGWRLPKMTNKPLSSYCTLASSGTNCGYNVDTSTGEMAHMFYITLGDIARYDTSGCPPSFWGCKTPSGFWPKNAGPFNHLKTWYYWYATEYAPKTENAWAFEFGYGTQYYFRKKDSVYAWAVHSGDVGKVTVPLPAAEHVR